MSIENDFGVPINAGKRRGRKRPSDLKGFGRFTGKCKQTRTQAARAERRQGKRAAQLPAE